MQAQSTTLRRLNITSTRQDTIVKLPRTTKVAITRRLVITPTLPVGTVITPPTTRLKRPSFMPTNTADHSIRIAGIRSNYQARLLRRAFSFSNVEFVERNGVLDMNTKAHNGNRAAVLVIAGIRDVLVVKCE